MKYLGEAVSRTVQMESFSKLPSVDPLTVLDRHNLEPLTVLGRHDLDPLTVLGGHNLEPLMVLDGLNVDPLTFSQRRIVRAFHTFQLI